MPVNDAPAVTLLAVSMEQLAAAAPLFPNSMWPSAASANVALDVRPMSTASSQGLGPAQRGSGGQGSAGSPRPSLTLRFNRAKEAEDDLSDVIGVVGRRPGQQPSQLAGGFAASAAAASRALLPPVPFCHLPCNRMSLCYSQHCRSCPRPAS